MKKVANIFVIGFIFVPVAAVGYLVFFPIDSPNNDSGSDILRRLPSANRVKIDYAVRGGRAQERHEITLSQKREVQNLLSELEGQSGGEGGWHGGEPVIITFYFDHGEPIETVLARPVLLMRRAPVGWSIFLKNDGFFAKVCEYIKQDPRLRLGPDNHLVWSRLFADHLKQARSVKIVRKTAGAAAEELEVQDPWEITRLGETMQDDLLAKGYVPTQARKADLVVRFDTEGGPTEFFHIDSRAWIAKWPRSDPNFDVQIYYYNKNILYERVIELLDKAGKQTPETKPP